MFRTASSIVHHVNMHLGKTLAYELLEGNNEDCTFDCKQQEANCACDSTWMTRAETSYQGKLTYVHAQEYPEWPSVWNIHINNQAFLCQTQQRRFSNFTKMSWRSLSNRTWLQVQQSMCWCANSCREMHWWIKYVHLQDFWLKLHVGKYYYQQRL